MQLIGWSPPQWLVVFALLLATALIYAVFVYLHKRLYASARNSPLVWDEVLLMALKAPVALSIWVYGVYLASKYLQSSSELALFSWVDDGVRVFFLVSIAWFALRLVKHAELVLSQQQSQSSRPALGAKLVRDQTTLAAFSKLLRACIFITAGLLVLQQLGISISGLLAFGGVGGLVLGFAAQQLLANFFGGLMLYLERPFQVGDWVRSAEQDIEGTIEDIGWRLTRIRTFDSRPLYVPNSLFNSTTVENASRMHNRRIVATIGLRYQDFHLLEAIIGAIRALLDADDAIDQASTKLVNFVKYDNYSLNIYLSCFTKTRDWVEFHQAQERLLLAIGTIVNQHGADFAFPTSTVLLNPDAAAATQR